jgi:hypothetical protein
MANPKIRRKSLLKRTIHLKKRTKKRRARMRAKRTRRGAQWRRSRAN